MNRESMETGYLSNSCKENDLRSFRRFFAILPATYAAWPIREIVLLRTNTYLQTESQKLKNLTEEKIFQQIN